MRFNKRNKRVKADFPEKIENIVNLGEPVEIGTVEETSEPIKVSVVIPVYNAYNYLGTALKSSIAQTLKEIEILCLDDGSTDRSLDIIKEYQAKDKRVRIVTENNAGPSLARNRGLNRARGNYIIFLDADDFFEKDMLQKLYDAAVKDDLDIAICRYNIYNNKKSKFETNVKSDHGEIFEPGKVVSKNEYPNEILQCSTGYVWNKLFKRSFLLDHEIIFHPELRVFEDTYFVVIAMAMATRVGKIFDVLAHHRVYSGQSKNRLFKKYYAQVPDVYLYIKEFLMHHGMYVPLSMSYLNLSATRCYKIYNLLWHDGKEIFWNMIHDVYAEKIGWVKGNPEDFEDEEIRDFVANILSYTHAQYEKRNDRGLKVKIADVGRRLKAIKIQKRIKTFFNNVFNKKKKEENNQ